VKEALKSVTMLSIEVIVKILESGVLEYVPIPGLNGVSKGLVKIWKVVKGVTVCSRSEHISSGVLTAR
jgi:hypothetical protein